VSSTNGHSKANVGKTIKEALVEAEKLIDASKADGITVRAYVSMAFGCPIDGNTDPQQVQVGSQLSVPSLVFAFHFPSLVFAFHFTIFSPQDILEAYVDMGADHIILADTIGTGKPEEVRAICKRAAETVDPSRLGLHMHNTYGLAIDNCVEGLKLGFQHFDGAVGGCGGCPFAPGAAGNLATSQLVQMLEEHSARHGMDHNILESSTSLLEKQLKRPLER
jgi:hydroxymethylglutaryl-CoA lyase